MVKIIEKKGLPFSDAVELSKILENWNFATYHRLYMALKVIKNGKGGGYYYECNKEQIEDMTK
tara:strand:+ start:333 stop:521 length:189 start_codon:yes stop_codon:yes gene_type:complete